MYRYIDLLIKYILLSYINKKERILLNNTVTIVV